MLLVKKDCWHYRVYQWWYFNKYPGYGTREYSNLCPYMRAVMFWAPMRALFWNWIKIGWIPINYITIPISLVALPFLLGYLSYGAKIAVCFIYAVLGMVAAILGIIYVLASDGLGYGETIAEPFKKVARTSFMELLGEYLHSAHDRVCPEVTFEA